MPITAIARRDRLARAVPGCTRVSRQLSASSDTLHLRTRCRAIESEWTAAAFETAARPSHISAVCVRPLRRDRRGGRQQTPMALPGAHWASVPSPDDIDGISDHLSARASSVASVLPRRRSALWPFTLRDIFRPTSERAMRPALAVRSCARESTGKLCPVLSPIVPSDRHSGERSRARRASAVRVDSFPIVRN